MIEIILYTLLELINYYLVYRSVFAIKFTRKRWLYVMVIVIACVMQLTILYCVDDTWRDVIVIIATLLGAVCLSEKRRVKTLLLYPMVFFLSGFVNIICSYGIAALLGITHTMLCESAILTLVVECVGVILFGAYAIVTGQRKKELSFTIGQYLIMLIGVICFFIIITFSQGLLNRDLLFANEIRNVTAIASFVIAFVFIGLSIWQQITWKKAIQYRMDNEKYEIYLKGQEEYIRMLILEDEKRRKLRHDLNAHMLAMNVMVEKKEWDDLQKYLGHMEEYIEENAVNKYTSISAVDAIVDEWHRRALKHGVEWLWEGKIREVDRISVFELCIIFSNLLSNAVEAVERIEKGRRIEIRISSYQGRLVISVGNACGAVAINQDGFRTSKEDKLFHGLGLRNVEEIVKKYEGSIDYSVENEWFLVDIVL